MKRTLLLPFVLILAGIGLAGCSILDDWYGAAETPGQKAFQAAGRYVYVATPAARYATDPEAQQGILDAVATADQSAHAALLSAIAELRAGNDDALTVALASASSALGSLSLRALGSVELPDDPEEAIGRGVMIGKLVTESIVAMRAWRTGYLKPKLEAMALEGRDPTEAEWQEVLEAVATHHQAIQLARSADGDA